MEQQRYTGDALLKVGLTVLTPKPIDDRLVVKSKEDLYSIPNAYEGMLVAVVELGSVFMLQDISKKNTAEGWAASYDAIQFVTLTYQEYKALEENTDDNYRPINEGKPFLHEDVYYYIYEESLDPTIQSLEYVKATWAKNIEEKMKQFAFQTSLQATKDDVTELQNTVATKDYVAENYIPLSFLGGAEGGLSTLLSDYYTKVQSDDLFVTKASLKGGLEDGDYVFVTAEQYKKDLDLLKEYQNGISEYHSNIEAELDKTIKTDGNGSLDSITVGQIKSKEPGLVVDVKKDGMYIAEDRVATKSEIPEHITLTFAEYLLLVENDLINEDVYYHILENSGSLDFYVTLNYLRANYITANSTYSYVNSYSYSKKHINENFLPLGDYVTVPTLSNYYTSQEVDLKFATNVSVEEALKDYVTIKMLGEDLDGQFTFVKKSDYEADKAELNSKFDEKLDNGAFDEELTTKNVNASESIHTPKIINNSDVFEVKDGMVFLNGEPIAMASDISKLVTISREDYDALAVKDEDVYYYIYDEDEEEAWVTAKYLNRNFYTKSGVDSKIRMALVEGVFQDEASYYSKDEVDEIVKPLKDRITILEQRLALIEKLVTGIHPVGKFGDPSTTFNSTLFA